MIISGQNLCKSYAGIKAVDHVTIGCQPGTVTGLLGTNGAGKSTLFKLLLGLIRPDEGVVKINASGPKPVGGIIEKPCLYGYLNARENLLVFARIQGAPHSSRDIEALLEKVGLSPLRKDPVRNYSMGMQQRLGIAIALINNPEALILDEPFSGLDPIGVENLRLLILELAKKDRIAVLIASHNVEELQKCCDYLYVIRDGAIIKSDAAAILIQRHTDKYMLVGNDLRASKTLAALRPVFRGAGAEIECTPGAIGQLLQELYEEGTAVTACSPKINMQQLFELSDA
jgi:ABC-2 type transport system ATP-binding protein